MAMTREQRQGLSKLLNDLFQGKNQDLLRSLYLHPHVNDNFVNGLPPPAVISPAQYQFEVIQRLTAFGIVDRDLFVALMSERPPQQQQQVAAVARVFGVEVASATAENLTVQKYDKQLILFLCASGDEPAGSLAVGKEIQATQQALDRAQRRDDFTLRAAPEVTFARAIQEIDKYRPQVIHFAGHGYADGSIGFADGTRVAAEDLEELFSLLKQRPQLVVFTCCNSLNVAKRVSQHAGGAIGFAGAILDEAAQAFSAALYESYGADDNTAYRAFRLARLSTRPRYPEIGGGQFFPDPCIDQVTSRL